MQIARATLSDGNLIVLGKGLDKKGNTVTLKIHSKLNVIAAGLLYKIKKPKQIIFTGGKTKGAEYISEAEAMRDYLLEQFTDIPANIVLVETKSIDTPSNITELLKLGYITRHEPITVLSLKQHLPRAKKLFWNIAHIQIDGISAQHIIKVHGLPEHRKLLRTFIRSGASAQESMKEFVLRRILTFDPKGEKIRAYANRLSRMRFLRRVPEIKRFKT
jgi:hypothetical protein